MQEIPPGDVTRLLRRTAQGENEAAERLYELLYDHLREMAAAQRARRGAGDTLQPTALVNEAWIRLAQNGNGEWRDREHFLAVSARAMRFVLVDHARRSQALKRKPTARRGRLEEALVQFEGRALDLLALEEGLERLTEHDERQARVVELRFFGGMTYEEAGQVLGISRATAERAWYVARAFLREHLDR